MTFDLFGTLVAADRPADPAAAVARELRARGVAMPAEWADTYREPHVDAPPGAAVPLPRHVARALGVDPPALCHVGDDAATDGGVTDAGGRFCHIDDVPLDEFPAWLVARA